MRAGSRLRESGTNRRTETDLTSHAHHDLRIVVGVFVASQYYSLPFDRCGVKSTTHVLIAGSRDATLQMLDYARKVVRRAHAKGYTVLVGDNPKGIHMVVSECRRLQVPVIVAGVGNFPRNGGCKHGGYVKVHRDTYRGANGCLLNRYTVRDRWMVDNASLGVFIW